MIAERFAKNRDRAADAATIGYENPEGGSVTWPCATPGFPADALPEGCK